MSSPRRKILVVEDDLSDLMAATIELAQGGAFDVISAERGDLAVMLARKLENLSLVIMDIRLPGLDGIKAIRAIREFAPDLPILAITAFGERLRKQAMEAGATEFFEKGRGLHHLLRIVQVLLEKSTVTGPPDGTV